jgi:hypothetical protein
MTLAQAQAFNEGVRAVLRTRAPAGTRLKEERRLVPAGAVYVASRQTRLTSEASHQLRNPFCTPGLHFKRLSGRDIDALTLL